MSDVELYEPPLDGVLDVVVVGRLPVTDTYLVKVGQNDPIEVPSSSVSMVPDDYADDYDPWGDAEYDDWPDSAEEEED